jgi:hypothetical protein
MTEQEFEEKFDKGDLDCDFAVFISERYDAWAKHQMLSYWEDPDAYQEFKDTLVKSALLQDAFFDGKHPLEAFPTIFGGSTK